MLTGVFQAPPDCLSSWSWGCPACHNALGERPVQPLPASYELLCGF